MKYNKGFAPIAIIAIIIGALVIIGGTYYLGKNSKTVPQNIGENNYQPQENQNQNGVSNTPVQNNVSNNTTSQIKTSDWKVYRNEQYGFELKYPNDWVFSTFPNPDGFSFNDKSKDKFTFAILPRGGFDHGYEEDPVLSDVLINGKQARKEEWNNSVIYNFTDNAIPSTWIKCGLDLKSCNRIEIQGSDKLGQELIDQIISTFKFTK